MSYFFLLKRNMIKLTKKADKPTKTIINKIQPSDDIKLKEDTSKLYFKTINTRMLNEINIQKDTLLSRKFFTISFLIKD